MRLTHLEVTDHRNIAHAELHPDPHLTVLCGPNGQGKTNLLEAIWLLTGGKSFRGSKDAELIRRGCDFSVIEGAFETQDVEKSIRLTVGSRQSQRPGRTGKLNGADVGRAAALAGNFQAVVFEPDLLGLVKGGPDGFRIGLAHEAANILHLAAASFVIAKAGIQGQGLGKVWRQVQSLHFLRGKIGQFLAQGLQGETFPLFCRSAGL